MTIAERPKTLYEPASSRADAAHLDFVEGVKFLSYRMMGALIATLYQEEEREFETTLGRKPATWQEVVKLLEPTLFNRVRECLDLWGQDAMWDGTFRTYRRRERALIDELDRWTQRGPGTVELDPDIAYPAYYDDHEIHRQPGAYHRDPLAGFAYDYGSKIFYFGINDIEYTHRTLAAKAIQVPARDVERILDFGCGVGQATVPFKRLLPEAQVAGIDLSAPLLKYAHRRAALQDVEVTFAQRSIQQTRFPDESFDLIFAFQVLHEMPTDAIERSTVEARRLLRPGGAFVNADIPRTVNITPYRRWLREWHVHNNGEPYMGLYADTDLPAIFERAGFARVREEIAYEPVPGGLFQIYFTIGEK